MKVKRGIVLCVAAVFLLATIMTGCSGNNKETSPSNTKQEQTETDPASPEPAVITDGTAKQVRPVSFNYYVNYDNAGMTPWGEDPISKWIKDNLKVEVTGIQTGGSAEAKLNTMIASNSLPDVMMIDRGGLVERLRAAGQLVAMDEYVDKYPNLKKYAGEDTLNMLRSEDGKLYTFPNWYTSSPNGNGGWVINTKIYKELGSPKLETFDDLYSYLNLVKEKYPDVIPLEVGFGAKGIDVIFSGFGESHPTKYAAQGFYPEGGQLVSIYKDPIYSEAMLFANKLFREKLITQDAFTQKDDQVKEKLQNGRVAVFVNDNVSNIVRVAHNAWRANDPEGGYEAIWPIHKAGLDPNQIFVNDYNSLGWNAIVITKNAEDPDAIFAYLDWTTSPEGQRTLFFGPQGLYWDDFDEESGAPIPNETWKTTPQEEKDKSGLGSFIWTGNTTYVDSTKAKLEMELPEDVRSWTVVAQTSVLWKTSINLTEFVNLEPLPDSDEGIIATAFKDLSTEVKAKLMFAKNDEEMLAILSKADADATKIGYDKLLEFKTKKWQENLSKLKK